MPESKKLSELISDLSRFHARAEYTDNMSEYHKTIETIGLIKKQIDQKFDNLEKLIDVTNIGKIQIEKFIDQKFEELKIKISMTDLLPLFATVENRLNKLEELRYECKNKLIKSTCWYCKRPSDGMGGSGHACNDYCLEKHCSVCGRI